MTFRQSGPHKATLRAYVEIDFAENTTKKTMAIRKSKELSALLGAQEGVSLCEFLPKQVRRPNLMSRVTQWEEGQG